MYVDRFAPSPTGALHLGHAFSAIVGFRACQLAGGKFLLRIEDLDQGRVRPEFVEGIYCDLAWLGLTWEQPVLFQSTRLPAYRAALERLTGAGLTYPCVCTRRDITEAISAPQEGDLTPAGQSGPDGPVYPGTCRGRVDLPGKLAAVRLDMRRAVAALGGDDGVAALYFDERGAGPNGESGAVHLDPGALISDIGDIVLSRRDGIPAYHLTVVVDDAEQRISDVTRGSDLFTATPIHRLIQALLGVPSPAYHHHRLIRDAEGKRLAKRDDAHSLAQLRADGWQPDDVMRRLGFG